MQRGPPTRLCRAEELRELVVDKWGVSYDVTLQRRGKRVYIHMQVCLACSGPCTLHMP